MTLQRVLVLAPTRRAASETFVRANLAGLPFATTAYFGDERPLGQPWRLVYGVAVLISKVLTRLGCLRLAGWPAAVVTKLLMRRHQPDLLLVEFGFHALRVMEAAAEGQIPFGGAFSRVGSLGLDQVRCPEDALPPLDADCFWSDREISADAADPAGFGDGV
jgi:hypothetical protein